MPHPIEIRGLYLPTKNATLEEALKANCEMAENYPTLISITIAGRTWFSGRGHRDAPNEVVVWYPNGQLFSGYGETYAKAVDSAMSSAWRHIS